MKIRYIKISGWIISLALIIFAIFYFDWGKTLNVLKVVNAWFFLYLFFIYIIDYVLRAFRWKLLIYPIKRTTSLRKLFYSYNISQFANVFLPAKTGELFRVLITSKEEKISKRTILGTLFLERSFDIFGMGVLILVVVFFSKIKTLDKNVLSNLLFFASIFFVFFSFMVLSILLIKRLSFIKKKSLKLKKIIEFLEPFYHGFSSIRQFSLLLSVMILSIFMWGLNAFILYLYTLSLSLGISFFDSIVILLFQLLGELIPSAPSSVGTFHASTVIGGNFVGLTKDQGIALGLLNHSYDIFVRLIFGFVSIQLSSFAFKKGLKSIGTIKSAKYITESE